MERISLAHWANLWQTVQANGDPEPSYGDLVRRYSEPGRHYHNLRHIAECLQEFDTVTDLTIDPTAVELALWFHDAVYDPHSSTNEEASAGLAHACLHGAHVGRDKIDLVQRLILATKTHDPADDPTAALVVDLDLAILGQPPDRFWEYERAIRAEYDWVPAAEFTEKRAAILARFLARPAIYRNSHFQQRYEANARANLRAAIAWLRHPAP